MAEKIVLHKIPTKLSFIMALIQTCRRMIP